MSGIHKWHGRSSVADFVPVRIQGAPATERKALGHASLRFSESVAATIQPPALRQYRTSIEATRNQYWRIGEAITSIAGANLLKPIDAASGVEMRGRDLKLS